MTRSFSFHQCPHLGSLVVDTNLQHYENPDGSELSRKCPAIAHFYTRLPLLKVISYLHMKSEVVSQIFGGQGLDNLSHRVAVEERRFVPPTVSGILFAILFSVSFNTGMK